MSSYINFYLKVEDKYCPIGVYSRNSPEYQLFSSLVPYGKLVPLTIENLQIVIEDVKFSINNEKARISKYLQDIEDIKSFNNSANEKIELIANCHNTIDELKEELKSNEDCLTFVYWLIRILEDVNYDSYAEKHNINSNNYLWAGIEAGPNEDIK